MCLYTNDEYPHIAQEDIVVYKMLDDNLRSPYQDFQYELDKEYVNEDEKNISNYIPYSIGAGYFHAFVDKEKAIGCIKSAIIWKKIKLKLFKAIIPKGSQYYISVFKEQICGDRIKVIEEIKVK